MEILQIFFTKEICEKIHKNVPGTDLLGRLRRIISDCLDNKFYIDKVFLVNEHTKRLFNIRLPIGMSEEKAYWMVIRALLLANSLNPNFISSGDFITVKKNLNLERWLSCKADKTNKRDKQVLFHGTDLASALRIRETGVDIHLLGRNNELGSGFYTTTSYQYALQFALIHEYPAVLIIIMPSEILLEAEKNTQGIGIGREEWIKIMESESKFWVKYSGNIPDIMKENNILHDVPVPTFFNKNIVDLHPEYKQTVFKSRDAINFLNESQMQVIYIN